MLVQISDFLQAGEENAQSAKELCELLSIDKRTLTAAIERERRQGSPICASCSSDTPGYYLASSKTEMKEYCERLNHRAKEIHQTKEACLKTLDKLPEKGA